MDQKPRLPDLTHAGKRPETSSAQTQGGSCRLATLGRGPPGTRAKGLPAGIHSAPPMGQGSLGGKSNIRPPTASL